MSIAGGKYSIVGLGMVVGVPAEELEARRDRFAADALEDAISSPLHGLTARDLEADAVRRAILDAGLQRADVDGAVKCVAGPRSGVGVAELVGEQIDAYPRMLGLPVNVYYRVGRGGAWGTFGIITALSFLEMGAATCVAIAGSRADLTIEQTVATASADDRALSSIPPPPTWGPAFGRNSALHDFAEQATARMKVSGLSRSDLAGVVLASREWAAMNPLARRQGQALSEDDYLAEPEIVSPYGPYDVSAVTDGAIALVVTTTERARALDRPSVEILGVGTGHGLGDGSYASAARHHALPVARARDSALEQAGRDLSSIDLVQLHDSYSLDVIAQLEDYGWCEPGGGGAFLRERGIGPKGSLPVNTGGGLLSSYHFSDLTGISEAVIQLRGEAGDRQVAGASTALVSGNGAEMMAGGMCPIHSSLVLGRQQ